MIHEIAKSEEAALGGALGWSLANFVNSFIQNTQGRS